MASTRAKLDRDLLGDLMDRMAGQDSEALFEFMTCFQGELSAMVRSILGSLGRRDVGHRAADVDFLVASAALVVYDRSARWQRDGAAPWVWAKRAIRAEVVQWLGHPRVEFVAELHAGTSTERVTNCDVDLTMLAEQCDEVATWLADLREVASERDQRIHIEYQTQKLLGDPSPALTVGAAFGLKPDNIRQIDKRVRSRLAAGTPVVG